MSLSKVFQFCVSEFLIVCLVRLYLPWLWWVLRRSLALPHLSWSWLTWHVTWSMCRYLTILHRWRCKRWLALHVRWHCLLAHVGWIATHVAWSCISWVLHLRIVHVRVTKGWHRLLSRLLRHGLRLRILRDERLLHPRLGLNVHLNPKHLAKPSLETSVV